MKNNQSMTFKIYFVILNYKQNNKLPQLKTTKDHKTNKLSSNKLITTIVQCKCALMLS